MTAETLTWETYWFTRNLQGDITAIYNLEGTKLVAYSYNAWGETSTTYSNGGASTSAVKNSLRYRGYYFDTELGLYYLQSRYYDARTCRFINADDPAVATATPAGLTDKNLYAYCDNNPVIRIDEDGEFWIQLGVGAAVGFLSGIIEQAISGDWSLNAWIQTGVSTIEGATTAVLGPAAGALISGLAGAINSAIEGNDTDQIIADSFISAGISLIGSGAQLAIGRALAGEFVEQASKTQLKTLANSLGYAGRNYKSSTSWTGKIMLDASKMYMNKSIAQGVGQSISFLSSSVWNSLSPW